MPLELNTSQYNTSCRPVAQYGLEVVHYNVNQIKEIETVESKIYK